MIRLSAFADEISKDLSEQIDVLTAEQIRFIELRGVWGKNVSTFTDEEVSTIADALQGNGMGVSCIGSPLGKIDIEEDFAPHLDKLRRVMEIAQALKTQYIRLFSFYIPAEGDPLAYRAEVLSRMRAMTEAAAEQDLVLLHENEKGIYGDTAARCADLLGSVNSPNLRAIFDPANFVQVGERPYEDGWETIKPYLTYLHIKDALMETGRVVPAGEGDGGLRPIVASLKEMEFSGFASLEPHLRAAGKMSGFSGPELFRVASQAFKGLLEEAGISWS